MATGVVTGTCSQASFPGLERGSARRIPLLRAGHVALVLVVAVLLTVWATASVEGAYSTLAAIRNILGFTGIALLAAAVLGAATAWLPTVAFGIAAVVAGAEAGIAHLWTWPIHPNDNAISWGTAVTLLILGVATILPRGPRTTRG